jgi:SpoVK/Ycf46/Vps4 family AAA+-type ATPase
MRVESIAEYTHRPLYYIGAGEVGQEVIATENQLQRIFALAKSWNAIVLLDEADVFLAKRQSDDMKRNAFVAVFLRLLEYCEGIIFLTTNRIEEFDPAFESRVHIRLNYEELDEKKRTNIWRNLLQDVESSKGWSDNEYEQLGRDLPINGREINNLLLTASAIAKHKQVPLTTESLLALYNLRFGNRSS